MQFFGTALLVTLGVLTGLGLCLIALVALVNKTSLGLKTVSDPAERRTYITASINAAILSKRTQNELAARLNGTTYDPDKDQVPMTFVELARFMNSYFSAYRVGIRVNAAQAEMLFYEFMAPRGPIMETLDPRVR
jgi:hypothetical protein